MNNQDLIDEYASEAQDTLYNLIDDFRQRSGLELHVVVGILFNGLRSAIRIHLDQTRG